MDLLRMQENYQRERVMLCFNGPISRSLIEEIGKALRSYLDTQQTAPAAAMDVFAAYIEMTQNIRHYARRQGYSDAQASATVVVSQDDQGRYQVSAGNLVEATDGERLVATIDGLAPLDKAELKAAYKRQLRQARDETSRSGAGLGLLDIARKSSKPMRASLQPLAAQQSFFSLTATI